MSVKSKRPNFEQKIIASRKFSITFSFDLSQTSVIDSEMSERVQQKFRLFRDLNF